MSKRTEKERVLRAIRRGPVKLSDFSYPTCDGGKAITRLAARIYDLRKDGYNIPPSTKADDGTAVYRLTGEPNLDCDTGVAGGDDRDVPEHSGGPTDPAEPATTHPLGGGHQLVHAAEASASPARPAAARVNGPTDSPPPSVGGQLFSTEAYASRNHYASEAA